jgi:hypothetical protein
MIFFYLRVHFFAKYFRKKVNDVSEFVFSALEENERRKLRRTGTTRSKHTQRHFCNLCIEDEIQEPLLSSLLDQRPFPPSFVFQGDQLVGRSIKKVYIGSKMIFAS